MPHTSVAPDDYFLKAVFTHHLNRIYNGKCFLRNHIDHLMRLASFKGLQLALEEFGNDVKNQILRMDEIYKLIGEKAADLNCNPITNIIKDEFCLNKEQTMPILNDMDIMLYVQLLEHVNITSFRMLIMIAKLLKYHDAKQLLIENFDESADNDKMFLLIAKEYLTNEYVSDNSL